jgi:hypothetical protein
MKGTRCDYDGYGEEERLGDLVLDAAVFPNAAELQRDEALGRLRVSTVSVDQDGNGLVDRIAAFGAAFVHDLGYSRQRRLRQWQCP